MFLGFFLPFAVRDVEAPDLYAFYKQISCFSPQEIVFAADAAYFRDPDNYRQQLRWELDENNACKYEYEIPTARKIEAYEHYLLDTGMFDALRKRFRYAADLVWKHLLCEQYAPLENALEEVFTAFLQRHKAMEAVLTWANAPSLTTVAQRYGIPVIHSEQGPLRRPTYFSTGYFDFCGVNGNTEACARFTCFCTEWETLSAEEKPPLFARNELLRFCSFGQARETEEAPRYEIGVVLQVEDDSNMLAYANGLNNFTLIKLANAFFYDDEILIRRHPKSHVHYDEYFGQIDGAPDAAAFIRQCKRICTVNSSVGFEALLYGKESFVLGDSPYAFLANSTLGEETEVLPQESLGLSFFVFAYLVPYELLCDVAYYRWRLTGPSECEIYLRHLQHYLRSHFGCDMEKGESSSQLVQRVLARKKRICPQPKPKQYPARLDAKPWRELHEVLLREGLMDAAAGTVAIWGAKAVICDLVESLCQQTEFSFNSLRGVFLESGGDTLARMCGLEVLDSRSMECYGLQVIVIVSPLFEERICKEIVMRQPTIRIVRTRRWIGRNRYVLRREPFYHASKGTQI